MQRACSPTAEAKHCDGRGTTSPVTVFPRTGRRWFKRLALAVLLVMWPGLAAAAQPQAEPIPTIAAVAWMAGHWAGGATDGTLMEEAWLGPGGGIMVGVHRDVFPSGRAFFEFLRIAESEQGLVYHASPRGEASTTFVATNIEDLRVVFSNPDHDFPQRVAYWLADDGLHARIEGTVDGAERSTEWVWRRQE